MTAETDLKTLLATMEPALQESPYVFCSVTPAVYQRLSFTPLGVYREAEGITIIATQNQASQAQLSFETTWACITLSVHSSLSAVGFLAAITGKLAGAGIGLQKGRRK
ncbi:MAG: ACT domain-containing protein [Cyanobacteriota bacterium]|nr:ACT domain-containing protein [Cyanobacteriota bacterium]